MSDVRMRGFASRTSVEEACRWIDERAATLSAESIPLADASGRILASTIVSQMAVPSFARAMMDGYAVQAADTLGAGDYNPLPLQVIGTALPAAPTDLVVGPGQAVRIMTGAPIPAGADAVIPVEQTQSDQGDDSVSIVAPIPQARHIGQIGEDVAIGDPVLIAPRQLRPQDLGVLSSIGVDGVPVVRQPQVRILVTGNEVLPAGSQPKPFQIVDANGPMLQALVARDGGVTDGPVIISDDETQLKNAIMEPADVVLISGGSSVGQEDLAPILVRELGALAIHGVAMRPSSPAGMGSIGKTHIFLMPGNPVSCLCAYDFFAGRMIRQLAGKPAAWPYPRRRLPLAEKISSVIGRTDYARVQIEQEQVIPLAIRGASILSSTTKAAGFVIITESSEGMPPGTEVDVFCYDDCSW